MSARQIKRLTSKQEIENDKETECEVDESRRAIFDPMAANFEIEFLEEQSDQEPDETNRESEIGNQPKQDSAPPKSKKKKKRSKKNQNSVTEPTIQPDTPNSIIESKDISNFFIINKKNFDYTIEEDILYKFIEKRAVPKHNLKTVYMVPCEPEWQYMVLNGISMDIYLRSEGIKYGKYVYSQTYMETTKKFYNLCVMGNEQELSIIMMENPCHVESLFRYSFLSRVRDEPLEIQKNLVERAIYILEKSRGFEFNFFDGKHRLVYNIYENRTLHLCLFIHLLNMSERCYYRACLEVCKLLLCLDPSDPLAVLLLLDFYCIKTKKYSDFIDFYNNNRRYELSSMPNMRFSYCVCMHYVGKLLDSHVDDLLRDFPYFFLCLSDTQKVPIPDDMLSHPLLSLDPRKYTNVSLSMMTMYINRAYTVIRDTIYQRIVSVAMKSIQTSGQGIKDIDVKVFEKYPVALLRHMFLSRYEDAYFDISMRGADSIQICNDPYAPTHGLNPYMAKIDLTEFVIESITRTP